ncbi:putative arv1-domain-containing protein [Lyophyllum shimeji]|uniref:Protein ARV n=1 Tax=Lyophyllum shimeji TaxID=47721 RepID=A0A9P3PZF8_LYOSH|nr:putative arv1-domain-containing protein [Lyophyllum shimeji]
MPICTTCTSFTPHLYTVYQSAYNLRLEQCSKCQSFADPYVEHDSLTLLLDLILLKRGVYRHLLYNRGTEPRRAGEAKEDPSPTSTSGAPHASLRHRNRERERWLLVLRLGSALVALDAFIRWSHLNPDLPSTTPPSPWTKETMSSVVRVLLGCCAETLAFHTGVILACSIVLSLVSRVQSLRYQGPPPSSDIRREFRFSLIPLTLFYSSLTKLFLLFLLTIWRPTPTSPSSPSAEWWPAAFPLSSSSDNHKTSVPLALIAALKKVLDEDRIDREREWVIRNVLGGMSAGFGLRVVLDIHPLFTSLIILAGWRLKTGVAHCVSAWVAGGGDGDGDGGRVFREAWRAYSIP